MSARTIQLHRVLRAPPEAVYRAFLEPGAIAKWLPPFGFTCSVEQMDVRVGGTFRMSFHNFRRSAGHSFGGTYLDLEPSTLIRYTDVFDDATLPGTMVTTVRIEPVLCGSALTVEQENVPAAIPLEFCYLGWQESLVQLAQLVEPDIPA